MRYFLALLFMIFSCSFVEAQKSTVAILDFENTSGKAEYDAFGKAISNMLITDLTNNIHPKKVEFFERSQLNKLLEEQKLQKSKNFDAKTAVAFGKLSGVNYVFVGSVFVLDGNCNFSTKLVDVQTSKIMIAKDVSGKLESWLQLKSQLAEAIAVQLNNPITLDPSYKAPYTSVATIKQYGKIISKMDEGDFEKAEEMRSLFEEMNPEFKYYAALKTEIDELKKQVAKNTADIQVLNKSGGRVVNAATLPELMTNITNPLTPYVDRKNYLTEILKNEIQAINALVGSMYSIAAMPSGVERQLSFDFKGNATPKTIEFFNGDLDYILTLFENMDLNKETCANYVFIYVRQLVNFKAQLNNPGIISKAHKVCDKLEVYNKIHQIQSYDQGAIMYLFDNDTSMGHLRDLLKN